MLITVNVVFILFFRLIPLHLLIYTTRASAAPARRRCSEEDIASAREYMAANDAVEKPHRLDEGLIFGVPRPFPPLRSLNAMEGLTIMVVRAGTVRCSLKLWQ